MSYLPLESAQPNPAGALDPKPAYTQTWQQVSQNHMIEFALRAKRLATAPRGLWLAPAGYAFGGAGLGALIAGSSPGAYASLAAGGAFLLSAVVVHRQRIENAGNFCADFMRWIDMYSDVSEGEKNSEYVAREALKREPSAALVRCRAVLAALHIGKKA